MIRHPLAATLGLGLALAFGPAGPSSARAQEFLKPPEVAKVDAPKPAEAPKPADASKPAEAPKVDAAAPAEKAQVERAVFGGGCFWCMEAVFERIKGVKKVISGFSGGNVARPSYEAVCTGLTGHAEVIEVDFDPKVVSYRDLVDLFWLAHDPTTLNRQGPDAGTQYRSVIFYVNEQQKKDAKASYDQAMSDRLYNSPIVTDLVPLERFWPADAHHQDYFRKNANANPYCQAVIAPKLREFKHKLALKQEMMERQAKEKPAGK